MEKRSYSAIYRFMHWAIAFTMLFLLFTIFLRMTWMNKDNMADIIHNHLGSKISMDREELIILAKQIRKPMWVWHSYAGYVLTGLIFLRFFLPFFGQMKIANPLKAGLSLKDKFRFWAYIVFYVCVTTSLVTGLFLEFGPEHLEDPMEEVHVLSLYYLIPFLVLHFGGVLIAEFTAQKGIISEVISGRKGD